MKDYLVSICLPAYNRPLTLERTLHSLINQTHTNLEIIVSDNCSPNPEVLKVVDKFKTDARIQFYRQKKNVGPINNFNFVTDKVTGDFFMKIGDDDWIDENYVQSCLHFLLENPDYAAAYGRAKIVKPTGDSYADVPIDMTGNDAGQRVKEYIGHIKHNSPYYSVIRKKYLPHTRARNVVAFDWMIVSRIAYTAKIKMLTETSFNLGEGGDSVSIEKLTKAYGMSYLVKRFPYSSLCINMFLEVLFKPGIYHLSFTKRLKLAQECYAILYKRFNVKSETAISGKNIIRSINRNIKKIRSK